MEVFHKYYFLSKVSGIFYGQDKCDKISNKAWINEKWLRREFNITSEWIHRFSY